MRAILAEAPSPAPLPAVLRPGQIESSLSNNDRYRRIPWRRSSAPTSSPPDHSPSRFDPSPAPVEACFPLPLGDARRRGIGGRERPFQGLDFSHGAPPPAPEREPR